MCSQVIILYVLGYRMQAVSVVSREVMVPRGLVGMARETVDHSGEEIARVRSWSCHSSFSFEKKKGQKRCLSPRW